MEKTINLVIGFAKQMRKHSISAYSAQAAYFAMLSLFPFMILLLTLIQYTPLTSQVLFEGISNLMPAGLDSFIESIVNEIYERGALTISISALFVTWSAGKAFLSLMNGMNTIFKVEEKRNYFVLRLWAALYSLLFVLILIASLVLLVFGGTIFKLVSDYFPIVADLVGTVYGLKNIISIFLYFIVFDLIYWFIPNRKAGLLSQMPGALFTAISWFLFSTGFSVYMELSKGFKDMYGSLTTVILLMLWLYFSMYLILIGAEINSYFEAVFRGWKVQVVQTIDERKQEKAAERAAEKNSDGSAEHSEDSEV